MRTKSMRTIGDQADRIRKEARRAGNEERDKTAFYLEMKYGRRIINHFGGYKDESEFYALLDKEAPRKIYAGY